ERIALSSHEVIIPGLIDLHTHLPQLAISGHQDSDLLNWLQRYVFEEEAKFSNLSYAEAMSHWFFQELLKNGTTTAAVFASHHFQATEVAFQAALKSGNRVVMGQTLMDQNVPAPLLGDTLELLAQTEVLYQKWHQTNNKKLLYAWIP